MVAPILAIEAETRSFRAMNTDWWIQAPGSTPLVMDRAERIVQEAEERYSRFRPSSLLSQLNRDRRLQDPGFVALVRRALELGRLTGGAFDIRVGPALSAAGYDRSFELLPAVVAEHRIAPPLTLLQVAVEGDTLRLDGVGAIDLGGIAKGWAIDLVAAEFERAEVHDYLIDGGGDIRAAGNASDGTCWAVGVGEGLAVELRDAAVCTSSTTHRRWLTGEGPAHHIIDPWTGRSADESVTNAIVVAWDASTADALATALIAASSVLSVAPELNAEVLLQRHGAWEMTPGMEGWLA